LQCSKVKLIILRFIVNESRNQKHIKIKILKKLSLFMNKRAGLKDKLKKVYIHLIYILQLGFGQLLNSFT